MDYKYKKVLYVDLEALTYEYKIHEDLYKYLGGIGIAYKLLLDNIDKNPIIIATGPLSGKFPFLSKSVILHIFKNRVYESLGGGNMHALMNFSDIDAIVIINDTKQNLSIDIDDRELSFATTRDITQSNQHANLRITANHVIAENYFNYGINETNPINLTGTLSINISSSQSYEIPNYHDYEKLYSNILRSYKELTVEPRNNPSCFGCPMGCDFSARGENHLNVGILPRCLVGCGYAESIYKEIPVIFACLGALGYVYSHSDLEQVPSLVGTTKMKIGKLLES